MSPDSALGQLAQRVARVEQRVDDLMTRVVEKFAEVSEDFRVFGPMLQDHNTFRADLIHAVQDFQRARDELKDEIHELRVGLDREKIARREGQEERRQELVDAIEDRRRETAQTRTMMKVAAIGLIGTFVTSGGVVLVAIITGGH